MRRRVRLTGRRQLRKHDFDVRLPEIGGKRLLTITANSGVLESFPPDARVTLRLQENKRVEIVRLGTAGRLKTSHDLEMQDLVAPGCRISISEPSGQRKGILFASTDEWTLRGGGDDEEHRKGIIQFVAADTKPQSWRLIIPPDDYPIIEVDRDIPNARTWARNDPVFVGCVLPAVVTKVVGALLDEDSPPETEWMVDWMGWVQDLMPGAEIPFGEDGPRKAEFVDQVVDAFCHRHDTAAKLLGSLEKEEEAR